MRITTNLANVSNNSHRLARAIAGAAAGCVIAAIVLLFFAAMLRWADLLHAWPASVGVGALFGFLVGLLQSRPQLSDARFGECPMTGDRPPSW